MHWNVLSSVCLESGFLTLHRLHMTADTSTTDARSSHACATKQADIMVATSAPLLVVLFFFYLSFPVSHQHTEALLNCILCLEAQRANGLLWKELSDIYWAMHDEVWGTMDTTPRCRPVPILLSLFLFLFFTFVCFSLSASIHVTFGGDDNALVSFRDRRMSIFLALR